MKFDPGKLVMTSGVYDLATVNKEFDQHVRLSMLRHLAGDWGDVCDEDRVANELALQEGDRLFSVSC